MLPEREHKIRQAVRQTQPDLTVVLENIADPLNISAVLRSCDAVGVREVFVVYTRSYLDRRGLVLGKRTSGGTFKWMDVYLFNDLAECLGRVRERCGRVLATSLGEEVPSLYSLDLTLPTALLFGNEDEGVSPEALELADGHFVIPQAGMVESLNLSVACAVSLFEARRQRGARGFYDEHPPLTAEQQEQLFRRWTGRLKSERHPQKANTITAGSPPLPPIFVQRPNEIPATKPTSHPLTNFDL
jgi:tRNA (guanosine-2'-O-)-methyltransferase